MASATDTTKPDLGFGAFARSRITRIIFLWNFVGLGILLLGVLLLTELRAGLTEAQFRNLRTQGELIANLLIETGTVQGDPFPGLNEPAVREVLRRVLPPVAEGERVGTAGTRVRVFAPDGVIVADTDVIYDRLEETPLPGMGEREDLSQRIERAARQSGVHPADPVAAVDHTRRGAAARAPGRNLQRPEAQRIGRAGGVGDIADPARAIGARRGDVGKRRRGTHPGGRTRGDAAVYAWRGDGDVPLLGAAGVVHRRGR